MRRGDLIDRILSRTNEACRGYNTPCWEWSGPTSGTKEQTRGWGYGRISVSGSMSATHVVMYVCFFGYIPNNKQVDHLCNNRLCCNPDHLELVTHRENQRRKKR